jgi:hypothetical protein
MFPVGNELGFYIPEDHIVHSHCRENLKSYIALCYIFASCRTQYNSVFFFSLRAALLTV